MRHYVTWLGCFVVFWLFESLALGRDAWYAAGAAFALATGVTVGGLLGDRRRARRGSRTT